MSRGAGGRGAYYKAKYGGRYRSGPHTTHFSGDHHTAATNNNVDQFLYTAPSNDLQGCTNTDRSADAYYSALTARNNVGSGGRGMCTLKEEVRRLDGKSYGAYKDLHGVWELCVDNVTLTFDHIQADPYATPSKVRLSIPQSTAAIPLKYFNTPLKAIALSDFLWRRFAKNVSVNESARSFVQCDRPTHFVLQQSAVHVTSKAVEVRFSLSLPAVRRTILGQRMTHLVFSDLPSLIKPLYFRNLDCAALDSHIASLEDQRAIRQQLEANNLVAFIANGSILPRLSATSQLPLPSTHAVPFNSPPSLEITMPVPNLGSITGMGVRRGITLLVGGGFHGKSTLLHALQLGVYNKVPGDGREFAVSDVRSVKIRAEDGRVVTNTDISSFITNIPSVALMMINDATTTTATAASGVDGSVKRRYVMHTRIG
eukprot:Lankesteria_metandrocarpae@DN1350_c0_g1_i1.p1